MRATENGCEWVNIDLGDVNLILFEAGFTIDNTIAQYATYVGRDASDKPAVLLTDFWVLDWNKRKLAELYWAPMLLYLPLHKCFQALAQVAA